MNNVEKAENNTQVNLQVLELSNLGFDEVARKRMREQLGLDPSESGAISKEDELLMFLLYRSVLY